MVKWLIGLLALVAMARCEREEQFKVTMDCAKYGSGNYVFGCNPHYWVCINSFQQYELRCYGDLVLDPDENRCNYREKVRLCTDPNLPRSQPYRALELFSCKGMPNGMYSTGFCDNFFHTCINGTKQDNPCPFQQYFDNRTKKCDFKEKVDECNPENLKPRPLAQPAVPIKTDQSANIVQTISEPEKPLPPKPIPRVMPNGKSLRIGLAMPVNDSVSTGPYQRTNLTSAPPNMPDCSELSEGPFENDVGQCSNLFWRCSNALASQWKCPTGLFFNSDNKQCDFVENVVACGGSRSKTEPTADIFGTGQDAPLLPVVPTQQSMVGFNCTGRMDGYYIERSCQPFYIMCTGGKDEIKTCPQGQLFDSGIADCRIKAECGVTTRFPRDNISAPSPVEHGNFDYYNQQKPSPPGFNCFGRADGFYELGKCQKNYVRCDAGNSVNHECPMNTVFYNNHCDDLQRCLNPMAPAPVAIPSIRAAQDVPSYQSYGQPQNNPPMTVQPPTSSTTPPDTWCRQNNKPDGFHEVGCAPYFYSCTFGFSTRIPCPAGLFYDPEEHQCNNREWIPICGGKKPTTTMAPQLDQTRPTTPPDMWCQQYNRPDGLHAVGCQSYFYACNGGMSTRLTCPAGLFFDPEELQCMDRGLIPICGGKKSAPTQATPTQPTPLPDMWCQRNYKSDGFHEVGCAPYFYSCNSGFSLKINCPGGLYYDPEEHQCNNREWIGVCGGKKPPTTTPPAMDATRYTTPPDMFCSKYDLPDGIHAVAGCANYYYTCNGGFSIKINCPAGLYYDSGIEQCSHREWVPACGGKRPGLTTTLSPQMNPTTPPDTWCQRYNKPDGFHDVGCASYFYSCNGGFSLKINCPGGLFYDPEEHECNNKAFIPACGGKKPEPTTQPPMDATRYTTPPDMFCSKHQLADGIHAVAGCASYFYTCNGGFSIKINCPANLFYDSEIQQCANRNWVPACGGKRPEPTTTLPPHLNPTTPPDTYCRDYKLPDGLHGIGCNRFFYACNGGFSTKLNCPSNLFFDTEEGECANREWIKACGGQRPITTTQAPQLNPTTPPDTYCRDYKLPDGLHGFGCKNYFYACNGGFSTRLNCAGNTYFDPQTKQCDHRDWIVACGGKPTTPAPLLNAATMSYKSLKISRQLNPEYTTPPDMWCQQHKKTDGMHAIGCSNYFYACNGGFSTRLSCPGNLYFDETEEHCTHQEWIVACGGQKPTTLPPQLNPTMPTTPPDMWCEQYNMPDGLHGAGCKNFFYSCNGGFSTKLTCPTGLYYDTEEQQCTQRDWIKACGGKKPATSPPQLNPTKPTPPPDMWCQKNYKPDGFHGVGCAAYFYSCNSGFSLKINCPGGLYYDPEDHECNNREFIPACGGKKPETTTQPPMDATRYTTPPDMFCTKYNLADGLHAVAGCASYFYTCNGGFSIKINCPAGLFYDSGLEQCTNREWVPACGGKRPEPTTTLPPHLNPTTPPDTWCQRYNKPDGFHEVGCANYFYSCNGGLSLKINCPGGLFYDPEEHECNNKAFIPACGGKKPEPTTQPALDSRPTTPPDTYCRDYKLPDGLHGVGCQNFFYSCNGGFSTKLNCPANLYYDPEVGQCTNRKWIPICGGTRPIPTTQPPQLNPTTPPETFCRDNKLSDGLHGMGCNRFFYACNAGFSTKLDCPGGLYFDTEAQECTNRAWIVACGGKRPPPTTTPLPQMNPTTANPWCSVNRKSDGFHGDGCKSYFYICTNGMTNMIGCPGGLFFDEEVQQCENKNLIVACGGKKPTTPKPQPIIPVAQNPVPYYPQPQPMPVQQSPPQSPRQQYPAIQQSGPRNAVALNIPPESQPLSPDTTRNPCAKLPNGIYGRRCSRHFFVCTNHTTFDFICPNNQAYDARVNKCSEKGQIATCANSRTQY